MVLPPLPGVVYPLMMPLPAPYRNPHTRPRSHWTSCQHMYLWQSMSCMHGVNNKCLVSSQSHDACSCCRCALQRQNNILCHNYVDILRASGQTKEASGNIWPYLVVQLRLSGQRQALLQLVLWLSCHAGSHLLLACAFGPLWSKTETCHVSFGAHAL